MGWGVHNCGTVALMVFSQFSDICGPVGLMALGQFSDICGPFYWWRKREYLEKTTDLCHESLTNFITQCGITYTRHELDLNSQR